MSDTGDAPSTPEPEEKQGFQFPSTMTVLVIVTFLVWLAAFLIPSGTYVHDENGVPQPGSFQKIDSPQDFKDKVNRGTFRTEYDKKHFDAINGLDRP